MCCSLNKEALIKLYLKGTYNKTARCGGYNIKLSNFWV